MTSSESGCDLLRERLSSSMSITTHESCYVVNIPFIEVWFRDLAFRSGVYQCQPSPDQQVSFEVMQPVHLIRQCRCTHVFQDSPIFQLQTTFAALQEGKTKIFNPVKLVESLKLRTFEQQDAQESVACVLHEAIG
jgi:hypothetical protein